MFVVKEDLSRPVSDRFRYSVWKVLGAGETNVLWTDVKCYAEEAASALNEKESRDLCVGPWQVGDDRENPGGWIVFRPASCTICVICRTADKKYASDIAFALNRGEKWAPNDPSPPSQSGVAPIRLIRDVKEALKIAGGLDGLNKIIGIINSIKNWGLHDQFLEITKILSE